jgi:hypothetical protein
MKSDDNELQEFYNEHAEEYRFRNRSPRRHLFKTEGKTPEQVDSEYVKTGRRLFSHVPKGWRGTSPNSRKEFSEDASACLGGGDLLERFNAAR